MFSCSYVLQFENLVFNVPGGAIHVADLTLWDKAFLVVDFRFCRNLYLVNLNTIFLVL